AQISVTGKTHSSTVTIEQVNRLKEFIKSGGVKEIKKPKVFVVKKSKINEKPEVIKTIEKEVKSEVPPENSQKANFEKESKSLIERPKVEVVKSSPKSRLEIVRHATPKTQVQDKPQFKKDRLSKDTQDKFNKEKPQGDKKSGERFNKPSASGERKPIQRHIISQDIYETRPGAKRRVDNKKKGKDFTKNKKEEQEWISLEKAAAQKHKKKVQKEESVEDVKQLVVNKPMTISELSEKIQKTPAELVKFLMLRGTMATVNQLIDIEIIKQICEEYQIEVLDEDIEAFLEEEMEKEEQAKKLTEVDAKLLKRRAPVVSIMGHVDHGKTTLLDSIRASKHKIVATEVGGITQSIGAYTVYLDKKQEKKIVFVDTPGHEAFTEMRARGAKATDIAILVVAADDGIMPQTIEAINHAKAADVPIIVAVNKCDKPGANPDRVLQQLTEHGLVPEAWGGDAITVNVSALQGTGIDELLEYILLVADIQDLKANPKAEASGVVIEANLDKGKGPVATLLVQNGTLRTGNCVVVGTACGRVRALISDSGERIQKAEPSTPVEILGLTEVPQAGDRFEVVQNEKEMKAIVEKRREKERDRRLEAMLPAHIRKESAAGEGDIPQLNLIIKANTNGAAEAVSQAIAGIES
ncbi:translation initiation factor IF-2, partial [bacterium]|nr:translation initiation factor IF-2 [bacterium]